MNETEGPFEYVHQDIKRLKKIQKRFSFSVYDKSGETVAVYIRVKPNTDNHICNFLSYDNFANTLTIKKKTVEKMYKFTHVFKPETTQNQMFEECAKPYVQEFLEGRRNVVMFTYGASSSGKTYTIQGEPGSPGILPRIIASLINSLEDSLDTETLLHPEQGSIDAQLTPRKINEYNLQKSKILSLAKTLVEIVSKNNDFFLFSEMERLKYESEKVKLAHNDVTYSLWFSYYEIYNEQVFDLLEEPKDNRQQLRVISDKNHTYIDGLKHIQVNSIYEAYLIYSIGRYNLSVSSTGINNRSSRSHSIFTVKIIGRSTKSESNSFLQSSFTVCDLAGTERINRTGNVGQRLREAQRINSSFLTLNRCLRTIRYNQNSGFNRCIPYRESKLTKILGPSLTSTDTCLAMIVTVSQTEDLVEETESSLKASSVAATIKATAVKPSKALKTRRFSSTVSADHINWNEAATGKSSILTNDETARKETFKQENAARTFSPLCMDSSIPDVYKELEEEKKKRKAAEEKLLESERLFKKEIERLEKQVHRSSAENTINVLQKKLEEQEEDFMESQTENLKLKKTLRLLKEEKSKLDEQIKNLENINKGLNEMLDDAKEDVEDLQNEVNDLEKILKEKEDLILLKDEKLLSLESEILELEQNLENNAIEIEAYDKQLMGVEKDLSTKKMEMKNVMDKFEELTEDFKKVDGELVRLKERYKIEKEKFAKELEEAHNLVKNYEKQMKTKKYQRNAVESDDNGPTYLPPSNCKSRTTIKKKKKSKRDVHNLSASSLLLKIDTSNKLPTSTTKARKKLFQQNSCYLYDASNSESINDEAQSSPSIVLRKTLRSRKVY